MKPSPPFRPATIHALAKVMADTEVGLTGTEIGTLLLECGIPDNYAASTKWKRLANALGETQNHRKTSNHIVAFVHKAMSPVLHVGDQGYYDFMRSGINRVLSFEGLILGEDGRLKKTTPAQTIADAEARASQLKAALLSRNVHHDVLRHCRAELVQENYFHAVLEATKSIASKIRELSGLQGDGADLATKTFGLGATGPVLAINPLTTDTEKGEQRGFVNLLVGVFGTFRNPVAHAEKIYWEVNEQDALDILSAVSLIHRKLDRARKLP